MRLTLKTLKPRNPCALAARHRQAGAHRRSEKSRRQAAARELRTDWASRPPT